MIRRQLDIATEAAFYEALAAGDIGVLDLTPTDWGRIAGLLDTYTDIGLDAADASVITDADPRDRNLGIGLAASSFARGHTLSEAPRAEAASDRR